MSDPDGREAITEIDDPKEYSEARRIRELHDAHAYATDAKQQVVQAFASGSISRKAGLRLYRTAIESYLMQIEPIIVAIEVDGDGGDKSNDADGLSETAHDLWYEEPVATIRLTPPDDLLEQARRDGLRRRVGATAPEPVTRQLRGLEDVLDEPMELSETFSVVVRGEDGRPSETTATATAMLPIGTLDRVFRNANRLLQDLGVWAEIQTGEDRAEWSTDYRANGDPDS